MLTVPWTFNYNILISVKYLVASIEKINLMALFIFIELKLYLTMDLFAFHLVFHNRNN